MYEYNTADINKLQRGGGGGGDLKLLDYLERKSSVMQGRCTMFIFMQLIDINRHGIFVVYVTFD